MQFAIFFSFFAISLQNYYRIELNLTTPEYKIHSPLVAEQTHAMIAQIMAKIWNNFIFSRVF